jgi:Spy/CpxP family protein refolding chaperone
MTAIFVTTLALCASAASAQASGTTGDGGMSQGAMGNSGMSQGAMGGKEHHWLKKKSKMKKSDGMGMNHAASSTSAQ